MTSSRLVRGSKTRMFACICLGLVLGAVAFVFHGTQSRLDQAQKVIDSFRHEKESLSAQLQVTLESRKRLETFLKENKAEFKKSVDELEEKLNEERRKLSKEKEMSQEKVKAIEEQYHSLKAENERNEQTISHLKAQKSSLDLSIDQLKSDIDKLKDEKEHLKKSLGDCKSDNENGKPFAAPKPIALEEEKKSVVEMPKIAVPTNLSVSSTPGVDPMAVSPAEMVSVMSPKDSDKKQDEQVGMPPKKPTPETGVQKPNPLQKPKEEEGPEGGQIPGPPDPGSNTLHKPNLNAENENHGGEIHDAVGPMNPVQQGNQMGGGNSLNLFNPANKAEARDLNKAEEEDINEESPLNQNENPEIPRQVKNENYHAGDYDKEQQEEEDEDGEQNDDYDDRMNMKKAGFQKMKQALRNEEEGVIMNPV